MADIVSNATRLLPLPAYEKAEMWKCVGGAAFPLSYLAAESNFRAVQ